MRKLLITIALACFISPLSQTFVYGKSIPYFRENVKIPPEIAKTTTIFGAQAYLESPDEATRIAAARRLGQLGDPRAVSFLMERFAKEPYYAGIDCPPYVKIEIIEALGKIGGEKAKKSLLSIFNTYWQRGPKTKRYVWHDSDYARVIPATLEALYTWRDDKKIINLFENVYLQERKIHNWYTRQKAYGLYLRAKMQKEGAVSVKESVKYLSKMLTGRGAGWDDDWAKPGVKTLEALRNGAMVDILKSYGQTILPYLDKETKQIKSDTPADNKRREAFIYITHCIRDQLKRQTEKQNK